ncbi:MAG: Co2+/Mg2+ efflux protein ApaG [Planctomycetota bacterium]
MTTEGIRVRVAAQYAPDQSDPEEREWFFAYRVILSNEGDERAVLRSRHWIIVDADGERHDVKGPGVVGEHPDLSPGDRFEYMSGCPLSTPWGTMEGNFRMVREDGREFDAKVGRFFLAEGVAPLSELEGAMS